MTRPLKVWIFGAALALASCQAFGQATLNFNAFVLQGQIPNANILNPLTTVNGVDCALGGTCTAPIDSGGAATNTVPVVTAPNTVTWEQVPNAALANASTTVNGTACTLGSTCTVVTAATSVAVGTTTVLDGTPGRILYNNAGVLGEMTGTGSGTTPVFNTDPTITGATLAGAAKLTGGVATSGTAIPAQITANQNDYNPGSTNCTGVSTLLINSNAAVDITGLGGPTSGCRLTVINNGSFLITLKTQSASSTAANRFDLGSDFVLGTNSGVSLFYDPLATRWRNAAVVNANGYRLKGITTLDTGSGTYNTPSGVRALLVELVGGGGGGGGVSGSSGNVGAGGGGGGGAYCRLFIVNPSASYAYAIGTGGSGGTGGGGGAISGSSTTFGGSLVIAGPGIGGGGDISDVGPRVGGSAGSGGSGSGSGASFCVSGGSGGRGMGITNTVAMSGAGGASGITGGPMGAISVTAVVGSLDGISAPIHSGAGGSGAVSSANINRNGGDGAGGWLRITEYY